MQFIYKENRVGIIFPILFVTLTIASCKRMLEVSASPTTINSSNVYNSDATTAAVLTGIYTNLINAGSLQYLGVSSISLYAGISSDELTLYPGENNISYTEFYTNELNSADINPDFWSNIYPIVYTINASIEGVTGSGSLSPDVRQQALGEAYFMRAFCYFYLVNLYGDVPLILTTDYKVNAIVNRTPQIKVWQQIIADLQSAKILLSSNYLDGTLQTTTIQRVRPTKWAADALLARAFLYTNDWADAEMLSDSVINNSSLFNLSTLNNCFLANSDEAIWQLQPVVMGLNTPDAQLFIIPSTGPGGSWPVYLSPQLLNSFELGDQRKRNWIDSVIVNGVVYYYPYKYKSNLLNAPVTEYEMVLRLGELYLIRAEAEAEGAVGGIGAAIVDLNTIRERAGLQPYAGNINQVSVLNAIYHERQVELFTEWGHRWFDLKRTETIDSVMGSPGNLSQVKSGITWNPEWQWYPIALSQLQADPNLIQNPGY